DERLLGALLGSAYCKPGDALAEEPLARYEVQGAEEIVQRRVADEADGPHIRPRSLAGRTRRFRDRLLVGTTGIAAASVDLGRLVEYALLVWQVDDLLSLLDRATGLGERAEGTAGQHAAERSRDEAAELASGEHRSQRPEHGPGLHEESADAGVVAQPPGRRREDVALEAGPLLGDDRLDRPALVSSLA